MSYFLFILFFEKSQANIVMQYTIVCLILNGTNDKKDVVVVHFISVCSLENHEIFIMENFGLERELNQIFGTLNSESDVNQCIMACVGHESFLFMSA